MITYQRRRFRNRRESLSLGLEQPNSMNVLAGFHPDSELFPEHKLSSNSDNVDSGPPAVHFDLDRIEVGSVYEIDQSNLPVTIPAHLRSIRVAMVSDKTKLNVVVRYPSPGSLETSNCIREMYPAMDEKFVMGTALATKVLGRMVPSKEFAEMKHSKEFWLARTDSPRTGEVNCLAELLKGGGMVRWGTRRQVKFLKRSEEGSITNNDQSASSFLSAESIEGCENLDRTEDDIDAEEEAVDGGEDEDGGDQDVNLKRKRYMRMSTGQYTEKKRKVVKSRKRLLPEKSKSGKRGKKQLPDSHPGGGTQYGSATLNSNHSHREEVNAEFDQHGKRENAGPNKVEGGKVSKHSGVEGGEGDGEGEFIKYTSKSALKKQRQAQKQKREDEERKQRSPTPSPSPPVTPIPFEERYEVVDPNLSKDEIWKFQIFILPALLRFRSINVKLLVKNLNLTGERALEKLICTTHGMFYCMDGGGMSSGEAKVKHVYNEKTRVAVGNIKDIEKYMFDELHKTGDRLRRRSYYKHVIKPKKDWEAVSFFESVAEIASKLFPVIKEVFEGIKSKKTTHQELQARIKLPITVQVGNVETDYDHDNRAAVKVSAEDEKALSAINFFVEKKTLKFVDCRKFTTDPVKSGQERRSERTLFTVP